MRFASLTIAGWAAAMAATVGAQDLPTTQLEDHAAVVRQDSLTRSLLRQNQPRPDTRQETRRPTAAQVSACAAKERFRAEHGAENPKVQQLYELCRGVGL